MKKRLPLMLILAAVLIFCLPLVYVYTTHTPEAEEEIESEEDEFLREQTGAWEAMQLEIEKTKDPRLGYVPKDRLLKAYQYTEALRKKQAAMRAIQGITWQERGPNNVAGRTNALLIDANDPTGNTIWAAGSTGGLWKTTNMKATNTTWKPINDFFANLAIVTIAQDPVDPKVMYFGTGDINVRGLGIWKSTNGGTSWTHLDATNDGGDFFDVNRIIVTPSRTVLVATSTGVMRSTDKGLNWSKVTTGTATDVIQATDNAIYTGISGKIRKSTNDGQTFNDLNTPALGTSNIVIAAAPSNASVLYAMGANGGAVGGMARSDNGGTTWTSLTIPRIADGTADGGTKDFTRDQAWYDLEVAVDPTNPSHVWIGGIDLLKSTDKGATWQWVSQWYGGFGLPYVHADQHFILFDKNTPTTAYFACDGGVFTSTNTRATKPTFTEKNKNYNITYFYCVALHPGSASNYIMAGAQDNGTQVMNAAGVSEGDQVKGGDGMFCHIDQDNSNIQVASYVYNSYSISTDGGNTFKNLDNDQLEGRFVNPTDWHNKSNRLYAAAASGSYRVYTDPVTSTAKKDVVVSNFGTGQVSAITCSDKTADRVWFGLGNGTVVRAENAAGTTPTFTTLRTGTGYVSCIAVDPANENHLLVTSSSYGVTHVSETKDNGATWTAVDGNLPDMPVRWAMFSPLNGDKALLATEIGVWSTDNLNGTATDWAPSNSGLANVRTDMLQYRTSDKVMAAATFGRGVFTSAYFKTATARENSVIAASASKLQAYPNPFAASLTIQLPDNQVPEQADLYDGKGVRQQVSLKGLGNGAYQLQTASLATGIYYLKVRTTDGLQVMKVVKQ